MITPFGRYRWRRLPFGLKVPSEIFLRNLDEALGGLEGVFSVVDDIIIAGCSQTEEEAQFDNQRKLTERRPRLKRCAEKSIVLNDDKQQTGLTEISFHGHKITEEGVKVDENKVKAIHDMPAPTDIAGANRLCGMAQYMSRFLPDLAETLEAIRALTRKDTPFMCSTEFESALAPWMFFRFGKNPKTKTQPFHVFFLFYSLFSDHPIIFLRSLQSPRGYDSNTFTDKSENVNNQLNCLSTY